MFAPHKAPGWLFSLLFLQLHQTIMLLPMQGCRSLTIQKHFPGNDHHLHLPFCQAALISKALSLHIGSYLIMRSPLEIQDNECFHHTRINLASAKYIPRTNTEKGLCRTLFAGSLEWNLAPARSFWKLKLNSVVNAVKLAVKLGGNLQSPDYTLEN